MTTTRPLDAQTSSQDLTRKIDACVELIEQETQDDVLHNSAQTSDSSVATRVSVLLTTRNQRWTVAHTLQSLLEAAFPFEVELVVVDNASTDGTAQVLEATAKRDDRVTLTSLAHELGEGTLTRLAIEQCRGDVVVILPEQTELHSQDLVAWIQPILQERAEAVLGCPQSIGNGPVKPLFESLLHRWSTATANLLFNRRFTDVAASCLVIRGDVLKQLHLTTTEQGLRGELIARLVQWGARLFELPQQQASAAEQSATRWGQQLRNQAANVAQLVRCRWFDDRFTTHTGLHTLKSVDRADRYNRWILNQCQRWLGQRMLEAGSGIGNLSKRLLNRERLVLADYDPIYVRRVEQRFARWSNVRAVQADLTDPLVADLWHDERLDTIFCSNVLEHLEPDVQVLRSFYDSLESGGHCIIIVPAEPILYTGLDHDLGHYRRYTEAELRQKFEQAGFRVVASKQFNRFGSLGWYVNGKILGRRAISPQQMLLFDRLWPLAQYLDRCLPVPGMSLMMVGQRP